MSYSSQDKRPDGLHCVYGKCQGIPHSNNPCHPGCSFTMSFKPELPFILPVEDTNIEEWSKT